MGDDLVEGVLVAGAAQDVERVAQVATAIVIVADDRHILGNPQGGVGLVSQAGADVADLNVAPAGADHSDPFVGHLREAGQLHHHVGAPATGQVLDPLDTLVRLRQLAHVD